jgi:ribosomal protein L33
MTMVISGDNGLTYPNSTVQYKLVLEKYCKLLMQHILHWQQIILT